MTVGLRPEAFEDSAFADAALPTVDVEVEVVEELGSDTFVFFKLDADPVLVEEAMTEHPDEDATTLTAGDRGLVRRARQLAHEGAHRRDATALDRPIASLLLLARERREPAERRARSRDRWLIRHLDYTRARLAQVSQRLLAQVYPETRAVDELLVSPAVGRISFGEAQRLEYRPAALGERFGPPFATYWFRVAPPSRTSGAAGGSSSSGRLSARRRSGATAASCRG